MHCEGQHKFIKNIWKLNLVAEPKPKLKVKIVRVYPYYLCVVSTAFLIKLKKLLAYVLTFKISIFEDL
jgi:hypothetical protein